MNGNKEEQLRPWALEETDKGLVSVSRLFWLYDLGAV